MRKVSGIPSDDIVRCYKRFLLKLESFFRNMDMKKLNSMAIVKLILTNYVLYQDVEVIVHCICNAAVKVSVESVIETLVSRYEEHFDSSCQLTEEHALEEMQISENGPLLQHSDTLLRLLDRAMTKYWRSKNDQGHWHFIWKTDDIRQYMGGSSKVLGKMFDEKSKLSFMDV